jgi:3-isopropylmalate/(R)-2-methylmalate dehydratase small subunit
MVDANKILQIRGTGVPLRGADIDTDRIIPARYLRTVTFDNLGAHAFEDDRAQGGHPFDDPRYAGAGVLVAGSNFGCGSSREHAPQALRRWGIRAFVGESFAEIFFGNCVALGLPCLTAAAADVARLMGSVETEPGQELVVDLAAQTVQCATGVFRAVLPDGPREQFLKGEWDALGELLEAPDQIRTTAGRLPYLSEFRR